MKNIIFLLMVGVILFVSTLTINSFAQEKKIVLGVTTINLLTEFFVDVANGQKAAADKIGVELIMNDPRSDLNAQTNAVEDFVSRGVDAILIDAIDATALTPAVEAAVDAGVPVIAFDMMLPTDKPLTYVGTDSYSAGKQIGKWAREYIEKTGKEKVNIAILARVDSVIQLERAKGFSEEVSKYPGVTIFEPQNTGHTREEALAVAENILTAHPDLDYIYSTNEMGSIGGYVAVKAAGRTGVKVMGWDVTADAVKGIKEGIILAMIQQEPYKMGQISVQAAMIHLVGNKYLGDNYLPPNIPVPITLYTSENIDEWERKTSK